MNDIFEFEQEASAKCTRVPIQGKVFYIRHIMADDRDVWEEQWQSYLGDAKGVRGVRGWIVAFCLCDESGKATYEAGQGEDAKPEFIQAAERIGKLPASVVQPLFEVAMEVNCLKKQQIEDLEKNSEKTPTEDGS